MMTPGIMQMAENLVGTKELCRQINFLPKSCKEAHSSGCTSRSLDKHTPCILATELPGDSGNFSSRS
ncbi:hypothetical protein AX774_g5363 [Zancudomyces culisetae]|uniref:Uncharacterized protein n=1 Tax=Zancudomyces culisetae TaxID=1213189 RepID=A0A1R1PJP4_ZANCU|nr:hypothetical protein AX774_g5363 [Zancudomyces culisetae]|eukprot:OMH81184.1 hypothetical protein AX774_g5363 [Zancudomyces culisetae]